LFSVNVEVMSMACDTHDAGTANGRMTLAGSRVAGA